MAGNPTTLTVITQLWLQESLGVFSQETLDHYSGQISNLIIPFFGDSVEIPQQKVEEFIQEKTAKGLSENTIFPLVKLLQRILQFGAGQGLCPMPEWNLQLRTPQKKRGIVILSPIEERQLTSYLVENPTPMHLCIFLLLTCGLSVGEVMGLQWKDVSIKSNTLRVHISRGPLTARKHRTRMIRFSEKERIYLRKLMSSPQNYLSSGTPEPRKREAMENRWRIIVDKLLLPPMSPTDLRHTFAVRCIEGGMDYETLSKRLGVDNGSTFRHTYRALVSKEEMERLERERFESRKERVAPEHVNRGERDPESTPYRIKIEKRRQELKDELDALEGDLAIIRSLRYSDCVQGANRQGLYSFIEKVLGDDKDGKFLIEYLRCNMRVADMPLLKVTTVQAIRRRVTHGFEKLNARLEEIYAVEGWEAVPTLQSLCEKIDTIAPSAPKRTGPKRKPTLSNQVKQAFEALERLREENDTLKEELKKCRNDL